MADPVTDAIADITSKLETLSIISNKVIYMFASDDLISESGKIGVPSLGVVYNSLRGGTDKPVAAGLASTLTVDIYIIGGQQCVEQISRETGVKTTTTQLLDDIRNVIKNTFPQIGTGAAKVNRPQMQREWRFVLEQPVALNDQVIAYVQRWTTKVLLT